MAPQVTFEIVLVALAIAFLGVVYALISYLVREERRRLEALHRTFTANERRQHRRQQADLAKPIEWPAHDAHLDPNKLEVQHLPTTAKE